MYIKEISGSDFEEGRQYFSVIDVRTSHEYANGHVDGAVNIPYDEILENLDRIDKNVPIIVYCRTNQRSQIAALTLMNAGYSHVYVAPGVELYNYETIK